MKITARLLLYSKYDDGAGAVGNYSYYLTPSALGREIVIPDSTIWKVHRFSVVNPNVSQTATAYALSTTSGSPPAYGGRTLTFSPTGVIAFTGANPSYETISHWRIMLQESNTPTHEYTKWDWIAEHGAINRWATLGMANNGGSVINVTAPVEPYIQEDQTGWGADSNYVWFYFTPTAADITAKQIRSAAVSIAEGDLLSRPYNGSFLEMGLKTLYALIRSKGSKIKSLLSSIVVELASYIAGDSPFDVYIPCVEHQVIVGVGT